MLFLRVAAIIFWFPSLLVIQMNWLIFLLTLLFWFFRLVLIFCLVMTFKLISLFCGFFFGPRIVAVSFQLIDHLVYPFELLGLPIHVEVVVVLAKVVLFSVWCFRLIFKILQMKLFFFQTFNELLCLFIKVSVFLPQFVYFIKHLLLLFPHL